MKLHTIDQVWSHYSEDGEEWFLVHRTRGPLKKELKPPLGGCVLQGCGDMRMSIGFPEYFGETEETPNVEIKIDE